MTRCDGPGVNRGNASGSRAPPGSRPGASLPRVRGPLDQSDRRSPRSLAGDGQGVLLRPDRREGAGGQGPLRGVCRGCGAYTQPRNGKGDAYAYCKACHPGAIERRWTRERVLEAMRDWRAPLRPAAVVVRLVAHARAPAWGRGARATRAQATGPPPSVVTGRLRELEGSTGGGRRGRFLRLAMESADRRVVVRDLRPREPSSSSIAVLAIATTAEPKHEPRLRVGNPVSRSQAHADGQNKIRGGPSVATSRSRHRAGDRTARDATRAPRGIRRRGDRGCGRAHRRARCVRASEGWTDRCSGVGRGARRRSRLGLRQRRPPWRRSAGEWSTGAVALRRRARTTGTSGGRERRPATQQRSGAATAGTAPTGGCTRRGASDSRQVRAVMKDRAILRSSIDDDPAGRVPRPGG